MIRSELITAPVELPLSLVDTKAHLRVTDSYDDAYIMALIEAATNHAEYIVGQKLLTQTWKADFSTQPFFTIPLGRVLAVDEVSYIKDGLKVIVPSSDYNLVKGTNSVIGFESTVGYPSEITVLVTVGVAQSALPMNIKHAIKMIVADLYENRESTTELRQTKVAIAAENLLRPFRTMGC